MQIENITIRTKRMIDDLKTICANFGLGGSPGEYKIITQVFLYKYLSDKFLYEAKKADPTLANAENIEEALTAMPDDQYEMLTMMLGGSTAKLKKTHYISYLFNHQNDESMRKADGSPYPFHELFDDTLVDIANCNLDIFSVQTGGEEKIRLFDPISQYVIESSKKPLFCRAIINKLVEFSFADVFEQKYDFFAQIFEYLIKDYNKDFGKYAEYYTPHAIANIIAQIMVQGDVSNVTVYDPAAGSGTLVLALAHQIGEDNCTIFTQDISAKSNEFLRLNLILNNLVHSLGNVVHDDTLIAPRHLNAKKNGLAQFDYIVSNPPFNMDFSESRDELASQKHAERFFAGVPNIPKKDKTGMSIYLMFLQHIMQSLNEKGCAAIVIPSGFLTDTGAIHTTIREKLISNRWLKAVVQMPTNVFANTNTSVSMLFIDKRTANDTVMFVDASRMGHSVKINDTARTILSLEDQNNIVNAVISRSQIPEFAIEVSVEDIMENENMVKPGLYFEMRYSLLHEFCPSMEEEIKKIEQRKAGLIRILRHTYTRNLFVRWFVDYNCPLFSGKKHLTEYGEIPVELDLVPLSDLIATTVGGEWGKEEPEGRYTQRIRCIRGTDIPNIVKSYYDDVPARFVQKKHIDEKRILAKDIVVEISGGSPIQSTGRICLIEDNILVDLDAPVLCTNFCRVIRLKKPEYAVYVYNYLSLLYSRGYFFNLENNTTGIKNLIFRAFTKNIKVPVPKAEVFDAFMSEVEKYCSEISI